MINGHTNGQYLDHPSLYPFWERAEALGATIYIHPTDPITPSPAIARCVASSGEICSVVRHAFIAPRVRKCRVNARVSIPCTPGMSNCFKY